MSLKTKPSLKSIWLTQFSITIKIKLYLNNDYYKKKILSKPHEKPSLTAPVKIESCPNGIYY